MSTETYEPISVKLDPQSLSALAGKPARTRRALKAGTITLTNSQPQILMPQADSRVEAWITSATETTPPVIYVATSHAGAQAQGGGAAQIVGSDTTPIPMNTTDQVWVSAATGFPVTVSWWAIYEESE